MRHSEFEKHLRGLDFDGFNDLFIEEALTANQKSILAHRFLDIGQKLVQNYGYVKEPTPTED